MLSSVLSSNTAIEVNIRIIRIFTKLRDMLSTNTEVLLKLEQLERQVSQNTADTEVIFGALRQLLNSEIQEERQAIGYNRN